MQVKLLAHTFVKAGILKWTVKRISNKYEAIMEGNTRNVTALRIGG